MSKLLLSPLRDAVYQGRRMRVACLRAVVACTVSALTFAGSQARAADCRGLGNLSTCIDADNLWPHAGAGSFFAVGSAETTRRGDFAVGLVGSYLARPISVVVPSPDPAGSKIDVLANSVDMTLLFAYGVTNRLELTLALPGALYRDGAGISGVLGHGPSVGSTVLEPRFGWSYALVRRDAPKPSPGGPTARSGMALAVGFQATVPLASTDNFATAPTMVAVPSVVWDYRIARWMLAAELAPRLRREVVFGSSVVGAQVMGALGVSFDILEDGWLSASAEAYFLHGAQHQLPSQIQPNAHVATALAPAEWILSLRNATLMDGALTFSLGAGGAIPTASDGALTAPAFRLDFGVRYAPVDTPPHKPPVNREPPRTRPHEERLQEGDEPWL